MILVTDQLAIWKKRAYQGLSFSSSFFLHIYSTLVRINPLFNLSLHKLAQEEAFRNSGEQRFVLATISEGEVPRKRKKIPTDVIRSFV